MTDTTKPDPVEKRLSVRIEKLTAEQGQFCLNALLASRRIGEDDMKATLNFMEQMHVI